jgi:gliding motility-associated-like protein
LKILSISFFICLLLTTVKTTHAQGYLEFVENKGQWDSKVKFKGSLSAGAFFLQPNGYTMLLHDANDMKKVADYFHGHGNNKDSKNTTDKISLHSHAYEVNFLNTTSLATIIPEKALPTYNNYFLGNDKTKWAAECKIYQAITYQNVYPNIDVRYYTGSNTLKYDIIVKPGGDVSKIALQFKGTDGLKVKDGKLVIKTSVGDVKEEEPYSYQSSINGRQQVSCNYKVDGNIVTFKPSGYDKNNTLIIDPSLIFSTFTGSTADNWGFTATYDGQGNFYAGGIVFSDGAFPVSTGAYQTTYQGGITDGIIPGYDVAIMKFNPSGSNRLYSTYLGGSSNEQPHSIIVDGSGNLVIAGRTNSPNFPSTQPTFGTGGGWDIFITKLNANGTALVGSRKIGGSGDDGVNMATKYSTPGTLIIRRNYGDDSRSEVILDNAGNIILASCTQSLDFPTTAGVAQSTNASAGNTTNGNKKQDGVIIKTNGDLSNILFSTYFGGNDEDAAFVVSINPNNQNIYVAGVTASNSLPGDVTNVISSSPYSPPPPPNTAATKCDGFITILNPTGTSFLKTTFIGTTGFDIIFGLKFDKLGDPYICGTTEGASMPILNAAFRQDNGKQFIAKLKPDLSAYQYSTNFGTSTNSPNISITAFLVDRCQNVYVSGWGGRINTSQGYPNVGTIGLPTVNPIQPNTDGSDFYFFVLEKNAASQLFGSFFGQTNGANDEHVDGGTSRFDDNGVIYQSICANCGRGAVFPTTPGVWSPNNGSQNCNLAAIKIEMNFAGVGAGVQSSVNGVPRDTSGCVPLAVDFTDTIANGKSYIWNFGDGTPSVRTTVPTTNHVYSLIGTFQVMLVAIDSSTCNIADTSYSLIRVRNDDALVQYTPTKIPPCQNFGYSFVNSSIAPPGKPFKANSFRWDFGDGTSQIAGGQTIIHTYAAGGTYNTKLVLLDTNYCNYPDSVMIQIRVAANVKAQFTTDSLGCLPFTPIINNTSLAGQQFFWDFGDGTTSTQTTPTHTYTTAGTYIIRLTAVDSATCNIIDSAKFTVRVVDAPIANFSYAPNPPQTNTPVTFTNLTIGNYSRFKWVYGDGDSLLTTSINPVVHQYNISGTYNACLYAYNSTGCVDTACQPIVASIIPAMDVSSAFTPNGDGINDKVFVRGYAIVKMNWKIYNRWGQMMFQTTNRLEGWDGKFNGVVQAQDAYHYVLDVEFADGTKTLRKGDITLLK